MSLNVVIPMAGHSRRFKAKGYQTPKMFLKIDGKPMIQWVVDMFAPTDRFIFITLNEYLQVDEYVRILNESAPNIEVIGIDSHELGPVHTALQAASVVGDDEPVLFSYCDFYQHWNYRRFLSDVQGYEGGIAAFRGFQPASFGDTYYAYLRVNSRNEMLELREKQSFTNKRHEEFASSGIYYIDSWKRYQHYAHYLLNHDLKVGNEFYLSLIYNPMVNDGLHVKVSEIDKFICWGTPEDLEQYYFWSEYFSKDIHAIKQRWQT